MFPGDRVVDVAWGVSGGVEPYVGVPAARVKCGAHYKILDAVVVEINVQGKACARYLIRFRIPLN